MIFSENGSVRKRISILRPKPLDHVLSEQTPGRERDDGALRVVCNRAAVLEGEKQNRLAQGRTRHVGTQLCQRVAAALEQRRLPPEAKIHCNQHEACLAGEVHCSAPSSRMVFSRALSCSALL